MNHIISYELFEKIGDPSSGTLKRYPIDQYTRDTTKKLGSTQGNKVSNWVSGFMGKIFNDPDTWGKNITARADKDHNGKPLDAGLGFLVGTIGSAAKGILGKIFSHGQDIDIVDGKPNITPEHQNLFIDSRRAEISKIPDEEGLSGYIKNFFKSNNIKPGQYPAADEAAENIATTWITSPSGATELAGAAEELAPLVI